MNSTVTLLRLLYSQSSLLILFLEMLNYSTVLGTWKFGSAVDAMPSQVRNTWRNQIHQIEPLFGRFLFLSFQYETIMKSPGGIFFFFCFSSCSTNSGIQKQKPNRLTIPHNIIFVTYNLFSMIIRYLERDIIRKKQLNACCCCLLRNSWQPGIHYGSNEILVLEFAAAL